VHAVPAKPSRFAGHVPSTGAHSIAGQAAEAQWPPSQIIAGQPVPPGVGQHSPQLMPSSPHAEPSSGSRPHQHAGSGSATAQLQCASSHVHHMPAPHAEVPPLVHVEPSGEHAFIGDSGFHGSMPGGQIVGSHTHDVPSQWQPVGGGPRQVGGHVERSIVPAGHAHVPPVQIGGRPASPPHALTQMIHGAVPQPPSPPGPASAPRP